MMAIYKEIAKNEQYVFQYRHGHLSEVITYRKHLINMIKDDPNAKDNTAIQSFFFWKCDKREIWSVYQNRK